MKGFLKWAVTQPQTFCSAKFLHQPSISVNLHNYSPIRLIKMPSARTHTQHFQKTNADWCHLFVFARVHTVVSSTFGFDSALQSCSFPAALSRSAAAADRKRKHCKVRDESRCERGRERERQSEDGSTGRQKHSGPPSRPTRWIQRTTIRVGDSFVLFRDLSWSNKTNRIQVCLWTNLHGSSHWFVLDYQAGRPISLVTLVWHTLRPIGAEACHCVTTGEGWAVMWCS